mmetsp:Transcript_13890/g.22753  ORF Transcript_13890/g.22753 Transcript_13890/m.22753 type:complete len:412 (+) Transcript_13890:150-1385(+)
MLEKKAFGFECFHRGAFRGRRRRYKTHFLTRDVAIVEESRSFQTFPQVHTVLYDTCGSTHRSRTIRVGCQFSTPAGPHDPPVAVHRLGPAVPGRRPPVVAQSDRQACPHQCGIHLVRGRHDLQLGPGVHPRRLARLEQPAELRAQTVTPVEVVVPEHRGRARVRQRVRVPHAHLVGRERPVRLRGARVVIVDEGDGAPGPQADDAGRAALLVHQPPELAPPARLLQDALGGEVKGSADAARLVDPVHDALPVRVLVIFQPLPVVERVPVLSHRELGHARADVRPRELPAVPFTEVEADPAEPHVVREPADPLADVRLHPRLPVVDIRRAPELVPRRVSPLPREVFIAVGDGPFAPVHPGALPPVPLTPRALVRGAAVIQHRVQHRQHVVLSQRANQCAQLRLAAVLGLQAS